MATSNAMDEVFCFAGFSVVRWTAAHRQSVAKVISACLESYGLHFEPEGADLDAIEVERFYTLGEFWVVLSDEGKVVGSIGYHEVDKEAKTVEIRKMYLLPEARGKKLGRMLLEKMEEHIVRSGYSTVVVETASVLHEACRLYRSAGYQPVKGVKTARCNMRLSKTLSFLPKN